MPEPIFPVDNDHRAALVVGRGAEIGPMTSAQIAACAAAAAEQAQRTGLPLVFVIGTVTDADDDSYAMGAAGILLASAEEDVPSAVNKAALEKHTPADVPASLYEALAAAGATFNPGGEDDDPDFPREGLFLVPGGWSIATLRLGQKPTQDQLDAAEDAGEDPPEDHSQRVLGCAAEDGDPRVVNAAAIARIKASELPLYLEATYC